MSLCMTCLKKGCIDRQSLQAIASGMVLVQCADYEGRLVPRRFEEVALAEFENTTKKEKENEL